jgi:2'-5' RNA ligase
MGGIANGNQQEGAKKRRVEKLHITLIMCFNFKNSWLKKYVAQMVECFSC